MERNWEAAYGGFVNIKDPHFVIIKPRVPAHLGNRQNSRNFCDNNAGQNGFKGTCPVADSQFVFTGNMEQ